MLFKFRYNAKEHINSLQEEFRKEDSFRNDFAELFKQTIHTVIKEENKHIILPIELKSLTRNYALQVVSAIRSVLDKDATSPAYRVKDEIEALSVYNKKYEHIISNPISKKVFEVVLDLAKQKFPQLEELSNEGMKLFEVNLEWYHITYMSAFH
ncbi:hypothetical protein [Carboxylicivirga linearis]|uniref:Uncharacterized protein n=1 Tax=Carboxylicivirga linearis TaxID=1628157 RepID=A0ABS5JYG7_9BACT|nr:hypothetical protein [Carboxylicivirga linearis]MBS2099930.1 hypothetical protein [Carboxylicivirga linearis]